MLFGRLPGEGTQSASTLFAALPSYATLVGQYLDRFGPYRLQPYATPPLPRTGMPPTVQIPTPPAAVPPAASVPAGNFKREGEGGGRDRRSVGKPADPVGSGPGVLTGYDRVIGLADSMANPLGLGTGFSNPGVLGLAGLAVRELAEAARKSAIEKINEARLAGLINDANRRVAPGTPIGRAGGVGTPGVGGGFTKTPGKGPSAGDGNGAAAGGASNRGPGSRGRGFDHFGGPR